MQVNDCSSTHVVARLNPRWHHLLGFTGPKYLFFFFLVGFIIIWVRDWIKGCEFKTKNENEPQCPMN